MAKQEPQPKDSAAKPAAPGRAKGAAKGQAPPAPAPPAPVISLRGWRDLWQIPTIAAGMILLLLGLITWVKKSPGPDPGAILSNVEAMLSRQMYQKALETLNTRATSAMAVSPRGEDFKARFHALRGEALYLSQRDLPAPPGREQQETNNKHILDEFTRAERVEPSLITARRAEFIAQTHLDSRDVDRAVAYIRRLPTDSADDRKRLLRRAVEVKSAIPGHTRQEIEALLETFRQEPSLDEADRLWMTIQLADHDLRAGEAGSVIDRVMPELQRLEQRESTQAGELFLILGQAYMSAGNVESAWTHLSRAEALLPVGEIDRGRAEVLLARIVQSRGDLEEARDRFAGLVDRFPASPVQAMALLGLGETEADLGHLPESLSAYRTLVDLLPRMSGSGEVTPKDADASIGQRWSARSVAGDFASALEYARLSVDCYAQATVSPEVVRRLAETLRAKADQTLTGKTAGSEGETRSPEPEPAEQARHEFVLAAHEFARHAKLAIVGDPESASQSLWDSGDCYDRAGDLGEAIRQFTEYLQARRGDPRQLAAKYRLARCYQARGDLVTAIGLYEDIIKGSPSSDEALRSYVPLALSYEARGKDGDAQQAEERLLALLDGKMLQPDAPEFQRALIELGRLYVAERRYPEAIARIEEALERYPGIPETTRLRFGLAEAQRRSADEIDQLLRQAMPLAERQQMVRLREMRLRAALDLYEAVRSEIEQSDNHHRSELEALILRNASLYRGDCAFDLADYERAIRFYDAAAQRYSDDPASLVAMVQIVNCYVALEKWGEARTAHERARDRLKSLPETAWAAGRTPMDRRHWERWLESRFRLERLDQAEASTSEAAGEP